MWNVHVSCCYVKLVFGRVPQCTLNVCVDELHMYMCTCMYMYTCTCVGNLTWIVDRCLTDLIITVLTYCHTCTCMCMYVHENINEPQLPVNSLQGLDVEQSPNAQDAFRPMPGLFSCAGVTGSVGVLCHARITQMLALLSRPCLAATGI